MPLEPSRGPAGVPLRSHLVTRVPESGAAGGFVNAGCGSGCTSGSLGGACYLTGRAEVVGLALTVGEQHLENRARWLREPTHCVQLCVSQRLEA
jgi:hypothetical protein